MKFESVVDGCFSIDGDEENTSSYALQKELGLL